MRHLLGLMCLVALLALPLVGCSDDGGTGGEGGASGSGGTAGNAGTGGTGGASGYGGAAGTGGVSGNGGNGGTDPCDGVSCDDDNPCTDDSCDLTGSCAYSDNDASCNDENACTEQDHCVDGHCTGTALICVDGNPCTLDVCDDAIGCVFTEIYVPCDDGNACTVGDLCLGGICVSGGLVDCDDQSSCTTETCEPEVGCKYVYRCDSHATCMAGACECDCGYVGDGFACEEVHVCADGHCSSLENFISCPDDCDHDLVVVVEAAIAELVEPGLRMYASDLDDAGYLARIEPWSPGTVEELKSFLISQIDEYDIEGALLVGNLPAAWYEQDARCIDWDMSQTPPVCRQYIHEEFPTDIFLQDRDATWGDVDGDGIYDSHSALELEIFVSRLQTLPDPEKCIKTDDFPACVETYDAGNSFYASEECVRACPSRLAKQRWGPLGVDVECCGPYFLNRYFERVHDFRTYGPLISRSALLFMDDDWAHMSHSFFGLGSMYASVDVIADPVDHTPGVVHTTTQLDKYADYLTGTGAEFVYQMIHSGSESLYFTTCGEWTDACFEPQSDPWPECYSECADDQECCGCSSLRCVAETCEGAECDGITPPAQCAQPCDVDGDCCHCASLYCGPDGTCIAPWHCKWSCSERIHRTSIGPRWDLGPDIPIEMGQVHYALKSSFINMYNCTAARFTVPNLGMAFTLQADYGLAIVGSTKVGGMHDGTRFHEHLAAGTPWGESFRLWYNEAGAQNDLFAIGMGIMGDPLLSVSPTTAESLKATDTDAPEPDWEVFDTHDSCPMEGLDSYEDYTKRNPQFFRP